MTFLFTNVLTIKKSNTICVMFFKYKNPNTVSNLNVIELIEFAERWEFLYSKNNTLCVQFFYAKKNLFFIKFFNSRRNTGRHFASHFYNQKQCTFHYVYIYIYILYSIFWYRTINVLTIRAIRLKNKPELFIENWSYYYDK